MVWGVRDLVGSLQVVDGVQVVGWLGMWGAMVREAVESEPASLPWYLACMRICSLDTEIMII